MARSQHFFLIAILAALATAAPLSANVFASNSSSFSQEENGLDAQKLNAQFATLSANDSCTSALLNYFIHARCIFNSVIVCIRW
jgi:hypothetical protein